MIATLRRFICGTLVVSIAGMGLPLPASAGMVATDTALAAAARDHIGNILDRAEVGAGLEARGVSSSEAKARVAALTDAEALQLAREIDSLPAGADGGVSAIVGALVLIFLVLLLTDLLGYTKVFPFTKPIRR
jgi:hypothetical protein